MFCNFLLQLNMAKRRHAFLALFVLKPRKKKKYQKMIRTLVFSGREKFDDSFSFKILGIVW